MKKTTRFGLATLGIAALGLSAAPLVPVWLSQKEYSAADSVPTAVNGTAAALDVRSLPFEIDIDLADDASRQDILALERETGLDLTLNSVYSAKNRLMRAVAPNAEAARRLVERLREDPRVEAADMEVLYSIPEPWLAYRNPVALNSPQVLAAIEMAREQAKEERAQQIAQGVTFETQMPEGAVPQDPTVPFSLRAPEAADAPISSNFSRTAPSEAPSLSCETGNCLTETDTRPNDPLYDQQWNFRMIGAEDAWKTTRGKGVVVAVIDTGVAAATTKKGKQARDFGVTPFVKGYDFVNDDADPYDDHGHGTHVAGTISESTNNNEGAAGIAHEATIMPLKVLSAQGWGKSADIADAIRFAADNGAQVINMSLGSSQPSDVIHKAVKYARKKGVVIVCAAGNSFREGVGYPAAFPECVAISSVGPSGKLATYSSWGKEVALAAPGGDMVESGDPKDGILQNTVFPESQGGRGDDYYAFQGTSMASPHAAAVAALVVSQGVTDPARVRDILTKSASPQGEPKKYGAGILSAGNAVKTATAEGGPKLRHVVLPMLVTLMLLAGGSRRRFGVRLAMAAAITAGFFGPDLFIGWVGADSAWNLLGFSVLPAVAACALLRRGAGVKVAAAFSLGLAVNLFANWHNGTLPFTTATFGDAAVPWTAANLAAAFTLAYAATWRAARRFGLPRGTTAD